MHDEHRQILVSGAFDKCKFLSKKIPKNHGGCSPKKRDLRNTAKTNPKKLEIFKIVHTNGWHPNEETTAESKPKERGLGPLGTPPAALQPLGEPWVPPGEGAPSGPNPVCFG